MSLQANDFLWVCFSGKRPDPYIYAKMMQSFVGKAIWSQLAWHLADGDTEAYACAGIQKSLMVEAGTAIDAVNLAIAKANKQHKPVVIMADDLRGIIGVDGAPEAWRTVGGRQVPPLQAANGILTAMRKTGAMDRDLNINSI